MPSPGLLQHHHLRNGNICSKVRSVVCRICLIKVLFTTVYSRKNIPSWGPRILQNWIIITQYHFEVTQFDLSLLPLIQPPTPQSNRIFRNHDFHGAWFWLFCVCRSLAPCPAPTRPIPTPRGTSFFVTFVGIGQREEWTRKKHLWIQKVKTH